MTLLSSKLCLQRKSSQKQQQKGSELGTLEWDPIYHDCLIRISNVDTLDFLLNPLFFGYSTEKSKNVFFKLRVLPCLCILISNGEHNFKLTDFWYATLIGRILHTFHDTRTKLSKSRDYEKERNTYFLDIHHIPALINYINYKTEIQKN